MPETAPGLPLVAEGRYAQRGDRLVSTAYGNPRGFECIERPGELIRVMNGTRLSFPFDIAYYADDGKVRLGRQTGADVCLLRGRSCIPALALDTGEFIPLGQLAPDQHAMVVRSPRIDHIEEEIRRAIAACGSRIGESTFNAWRIQALAQQHAADATNNCAHPLDRSLALLEANLSAAQQAQFAKALCFDVSGGDSGTRYRIRCALSMNVDELARNGEVVARLCFMPSGGLPAGDVMLAQKTALELFERDALKIARRYPPSGAR
jgi:hypothetical protein